MGEMKYSQWILERVAIGEIVRLREGVTTLGRMPDCTIRLFSTFSSRVHCKFDVSRDGRVTVEDFSSNGTYVNTRQRRREVVELSEGDRIGIGCEACDEDCETGIYYIYILRKIPIRRNVHEGDISRNDSNNAQNISIGQLELPNNENSGKGKQHQRKRGDSKENKRSEHAFDQPSTSGLQKISHTKSEDEQNVTYISDSNSDSSDTNIPVKSKENVRKKSDETKAIKPNKSESFKEGEKELNNSRQENISKKITQKHNKSENGCKPLMVRRKSVMCLDSSEESKTKDSKIGNSKLEHSSTSGPHTKQERKCNSDNFNESIENRRKSEKEISPSREEKIKFQGKLEHNVDRPCTSGHLNKGTKEVESIKKRRKSERDPPNEERLNERKSTDKNLEQPSTSSLYPKKENESVLSITKDIVSLKVAGVKQRRTTEKESKHTHRDNSYSKCHSVEEKDKFNEKKLHTQSKNDVSTVVHNDIIPAVKITLSSTDRKSTSSEIKGQHEIKEDVPDTQNTSSKDALDLRDEDLIAVDELIAEIKAESSDAPEVNEDGSDEVFVISDDEEEKDNADFHLSQSMIRDIKQEFVDFELEESFGPPKMKEEALEASDKEDKMMSPIEIEDDEDDFDDSVSHWANKLSQGNFNDSKCKVENKERRKIPEIITPPSMPTKKGKLRGVSAQSPSKKLIKEKIDRRARTVRQKEKIIAKEQELKHKWFQKPTLQRRNEKEQIKKLQEERRKKLHEMGEIAANKRKLKEDDDVKIVKKPKVKMTIVNRGAFLTENLNPEKPSTSLPRAPPTKSKLMRIPKLAPKTENTSSRESVHRRQSITEAESERNDSSDIFEGRDTLAELKIKHRKSRVSMNTSTESRNNNAEVAIKENNAQMQNISLSSPKIPDENLPQVLNANVKEDSSVDNSLKIKSILKLPNEERKSKKSVKFNYTPKIIYIDVENSSGRRVDKKDASIDMSDFVSKKRKERVDNSDKILSEILSWSPTWLERRAQEVNGRGHVLLPLLHKYPSFDEFVKIMFPLMKLEFWASIEQDFCHKASLPFVSFRVENFKAEKRGNSDRFVYYCDYVPSSLKNDIPLTTGDLCIVKIEASFKTVTVFAYVEYISKISSTQKVHYQIILQSNFNIHCKELLDIQKTIKVKSISQIRVDMGAFNAVYHLKQSPLLKVVLDPHVLINLPDPPVENIKYKGCDKLNKNQEEALLKTYLKCINTSCISLIEGPPGTGKSRLITNLAMQILYGNEVTHLKKKILLCSQSNTAIDVIVSKLIKIRSKMTCNKFRLVRFGILERMHPNVRAYSVQVQIDKFLREKELNLHQESLKSEKLMLESKIIALNSSNANGANNVHYDDLQKAKQRLDMINRIMNHQAPSETEINYWKKHIQGAHILCTTLSSCIKLLQYTNDFDICIIDEATQCLEPWTLIPLQFDISSVVLVGDTQQLPATILSKTTADFGLGESLFTRIQKCFELEKTSPIVSLRTQYRMHPEICKWPSSYFYKMQLISDKTTSDFKVLIKPYTVFNLEFSQDDNGENGQISNTLEAKFIVDLVTNMRNILPTNKYSYGIITPYALHRDNLNSKLSEAGIKDVLANTIDSYQGKEKDVIIISNARTKGIGFLSNCQRLNVAMTRAMKCLVLCGNFSNLQRIPVWKSLLNDAKRRGLYYNIKKAVPLDFEKNVMCHLKVS